MTLILFVNDEYKAVVYIHEEWLSDIWLRYTAKHA